MGVLSRLMKFAESLRKQLTAFSFEMPHLDPSDIPRERSAAEPFTSQLGRQYDIHIMPSLPAGFPTPEELNVTYVDTDPMIAPCPHPDAPRVFSIVIRGMMASEIFSLSIRCADCTLKLFERASLDCAECGKGITPHSMVAVAWRGAPQPFLHIACAEDSDLLCGALMFGRVLGLPELSGSTGRSFPVDTPTLGYHKNREHLERATGGGQEPDDEDSENPGEDPTDKDGTPGGSGKPGPN